MSCLGAPSFSLCPTPGHPQVQLWRTLLGIVKFSGISVKGLLLGSSRRQLMAGRWREERPVSEPQCGVCAWLGCALPRAHLSWHHG